MFGHLFGPRFFNSLEEPLACKQAFFPLTFGGTSLIPTTHTAPITYLGSWAFVTSIIVVKFMVDQRLFILKALARLN
jgi:hypothetical protein